MDSLLDTPAAQRQDDDDDIDVFEILQVLADNIRLLLLGPILIGLVALGVTFLISPSYTSSTKIMPPQPQQSSAANMLQSLGGLGSLAGAAGALKNPADQYVSFLRSYSVLDPLVEKFQLAERYKARFKEDARRRLADKTKVSAGKEGFVLLEVQDKDPAFARDLADGYVEALHALLSRLAVTEAQQRRVFFEQQLLASKESLIAAEQALVASGVSVSALNASPSAALEGPAKLRAQVTVQEVRIASMRTYMTEQAPEFRKALAELSALRSQLKKMESEQPSTQGGNDYIVKFREFKYQETLYELFARQYEMARVDESREGGKVQVIDPAQVPERKSGPKRAFIAGVSAIVAGLALLLFVFARHGWRALLRSPVRAKQIDRIKTSLKLLPSKN